MKIRPRFAVYILAMAALLTACSPRSGGSDASPGTGKSAAGEDEVSLPGETQPALIDPTIAITGPLEVVFDWTTDSCEPHDFPDLPLRPFRDAEGNVQANRSWTENRRFLGPDLNSLEALCEITFTSARDPDPSHFSSLQWFQALYTEDGQTIHAVVHNEHNSQDFGDEYANFWSLTYARSTDAGATFQQPDPPANFIGSSPYPYEPGAGLYGLITGSNIIKAQDDYYYMLAVHQVYRGNEQRICLLRTADLSDPTSWRAWDGTGFNMRLINPYLEPEADPAQHQCPSVDDGLLELGNIGESLQYSTYLDRYLVVSLGVNWIDGKIFWGANYSTSPDLIHWEKKKPLLELLLGAHGGPGGPPAAGYLILLDPDSDSRNFETVGKTGYIYYTRFNHAEGIAFQDNDLVRFPVEFFTTEAEAREADVRSTLILSSESSQDDVMLSGTLTDLNGDPIPNAEIGLTSTPSDGPGIPQLYTVSGIVPAGATGAFAGFRLNTECNCSGQSEFYLYEFNYSESGGANRVVNPRFSSGLNNYYYYGTADISVEASDAGTGQMAHVKAEPDQGLLFFSGRFHVNPGAEFTYTVDSRVIPGSFGTGFFGLFFDDQSGEALRVTIPYTTPSADLGRTTTDQNGHFEFLWEAGLDSGPSTVKASFGGDGYYWPSTDQISIR